MLYEVFLLKGKIAVFSQLTFSRRVGDFADARVSELRFMVFGVVCARAAFLRDRARKRIAS